MRIAHKVFGVYRRDDDRRALVSSLLLHLALCLLFSVSFVLQRQRAAAQWELEAELWSSVPTEPALSAMSSPPKPSAPLAVAPERAEIALKAQPTSKGLVETEVRTKSPKVVAQSDAGRRAHEPQRKPQALAPSKAQKQEEAKPKRKTAAEQRVDERAARLAQLRGLASSSAQTARNEATLAAERAAALAAYAEKVRAQVRAHIIFDPSTVKGNPVAVLTVECAPDGALLKVTVTRSSGDLDWDAAVKRAVQRAEPLPRAADGRAPRRFVLQLSPKER